MFSDPCTQSSELSPLSAQSMKQFSSPFQVDSGKVPVVACQSEQSRGLPDISQLLFVPLAWCLSHAAEFRWLLHLPPLTGFPTVLHSHLYTLRSSETIQKSSQCSTILVWSLETPPSLPSVWKDKYHPSTKNIRPCGVSQAQLFIRVGTGLGCSI